jgi:hypothetical protein
MVPATFPRGYKRQPTRLAPLRGAPNSPELKLKHLWNPLAEQCRDLLTEHPRFQYACKKSGSRYKATHGRHTLCPANSFLDLCRLPWTMKPQAIQEGSRHPIPGPPCIHHRYAVGRLFAPCFRPKPKENPLVPTSNNSELMVWRVFWKVLLELRGLFLAKLDHVGTSRSPLMGACGPCS